MTADTLILVTTISFLGMISPGPDFFLILKNSLSYSRKIALMSCLGVIMAILIHMSYCVAGIAILIATTPILYNGLRYAGSAYLLWLGIKALLAKNTGTTYLTQQSSNKCISVKTAFMQGLFCNLLNPKATLFFLAIFTQVLNADSSIIDKLLVALIIWIEAVFWWPFVVYIFQTQAVQRRYFKIQIIIDKLLGIILITLGIKVALGF
ncbi:lysine transporter LysE [Gilliamella apicola]|uniref:LysE family transporter n=1 Tax=Gilliamella apicola TaxID=1196095 RepID=UPI000A33D12B|nr:LysE family transporter [Gilliamella apicola]OTQ07066.1 lysine transporter LysE [Gilliamella apicola]OTQ22252.1 lysine transporter LysE [Gilliamella apicola]